MRIILSPQRPAGPIQSVPLVAVSGDVLTINGTPFDFSPLKEGATLPAAAIESDWFAGPVERIDGELRLTLRLPHGPNPSRSVAFPEPIHMTGDGPVPFPVDSVPEPLQPPTLEPAE